VDDLRHTVLLTGANGFVGTQIARLLLQNKEVTLLALIRAANAEEGARRLARDWWDWPELVDAISGRVRVVCGDVCSPYFGLKDAEYAALVESVTHIIHTAADWRLVSLEEIRKTNVQGTENVLEFAREANKHGRFEHLSHISTAYVAGGRTGVVSENDLTDEYGFFSNYERSKYEGELLVQAARNEFPVSVFRPSMIVGDSHTGEIKTFNTFYYPLKLYLAGKRRFMPVSRSLKINTVPVDYVAEAVSKLTFDPQAAGLTFHLVAPHDSLLTVGDLLEIVQKWARKELGIKLPRPICIPMSASSMKAVIRLQRVFQKNNRKISDALIALAPYFSENRQLQRTNTDRLLGTYSPEWKEIVPHLLEYAAYNSFLHRSDRTVHEQALFRLESRSYPVTYYDVIEGRLVRKTAVEMRRDVLAAVGALQVLGVKAGDRVALTGLNSTRYLAVDLAIGLVGAVSVPLYYTAPPADINQILLSSGSKLFFVGMPSLIARAGELSPDVPVVSLWRGPLPQNLSRKVDSWEEFLSKNSGADSSVRAPVGFGDTATLRYSSGTTGKPKGAVFNHSNLRYMAESTVSITEWRARNHKGSYLSFLPMGHVVEGILATYSPYYVPAPVDIYFLEDFRKLQKALPQIKPVLFFSVPRIYEKIWEGLEANPIGRFYISRRKGILKRLLKPTIRRMILKRSGLNRCAQLIAGSASSNETLLQNFRDLGVEIHNAYGLTEAPLVALNRMGRNRLDTVGEPMPETQIVTAEDGEIMVKGPQVTVGYFDKSLEPPFKDGWLMTGDTGKLTEEGSLVIFGRKKELIKTSYGKCIYSGKIECMMRELPGVNEALLVGESKPYCAALMWVPKEAWNEEMIKTIDDAVDEMNKSLSNPEKIKKWALLVNNLSIEKGDLTPNLKLKRNVAQERYAKTIAALYGAPKPEGELHIGGVEGPE
jgi:long-chain acyl-CoA synthetase